MSYTNKDQSVRDSWRTPGYLFKFADALLSGIEYDVACTADNALAGYMAPDTLIIPWKGKCWCNPPYSNIPVWVDKILSENNTTVALLIPSPNGESYYSKIIPNSYEIHIIGRIAFLDQFGNPVNGNNRGSSLFIFGEHYPKGVRDICNRKDIENL